MYICCIYILNYVGTEEDVSDVQGCGCGGVLRLEFSQI